MLNTCLGFSFRSMPPRAGVPGLAQAWLRLGHGTRAFCLGLMALTSGMLLGVLLPHAHESVDFVHTELARPELPAYPVASPSSAPHIHTTETVLPPNATPLLPPPSGPQNESSSTKVLRRQRRFLVVYWGGAPGPFQQVGDFHKPYSCPARPAENDQPALPSCELRITNMNNRPNLLAADAVIFKPEKLPASFSAEPFPPRNRQYWALMYDDAPSHVASLLGQSRVGIFNITIGYLRSATIPMSWGPSLDRLFEKPLPIGERVAGAPVVWVAQNCKAPNRRHEYVQLLMRHIDVHSYGFCLHNINFPKGVRTSRTAAHMQLTKMGTVPMVDSSLEMILAQYKFHLTFETDNCEDYVTEKFYRALYTGGVPVVMGAPNIANYAPKHSFIRADDFPGPKALAGFLHAINQNATAFDAFLDYKRRKEITPELREIMRRNSLRESSFRGYSRTMDSVMCDLCRILQRGEPLRSVFEAKCTAPSWSALR
eukprot:TRINITY_DN93389_c0_g1_i1.p1 TRINITY_DN93389_c0_g1~~TRINITY_DN93389_c0_g1_i1.p1  ORF type:complete len:484 (-),score=19.87 TRINITY_DN93389_c0_g1_i1:67-1518(-)